VAFGSEGRQEGDFHRRIEGVGSRNVSQCASGGIAALFSLGSHKPRRFPAVARIELSTIAKPPARAQLSASRSANALAAFLDRFGMRRPDGVSIIALPFRSATPGQ
jgi:hypothetical protein